MEQYVSGAVLQRIVLKAFRKFPIVAPPLEIQEAWFQVLNSGLKSCFSNIKENITLVKLRDTILPKLLSGELSKKPCKEPVHV